MNILFISSFYLFNGTRFGGVKRLYNLAQALDRNNDLYVVCLDSCRERRPGHGEAKDFRRFLHVPCSIEKSWLARKFRVEIDIRRCAGRFRREVTSFFGETDFDAVLLAYPFALSFLTISIISRSANIVYLEDDLFFEQVRQRVAAQTNPLRRFWLELRYRQLLTFYRRLLAPVKAFISISAQEGKVVKETFPWVRIHRLGYGIEPGKYPFLQPRKNRNTLGFIGNYNHTPNRDALSFLLHTLLPRLMCSNRDLHLMIAGVHIPKELKDEFRDDSAVVWIEAVDPLRLFYERIDVFINPIVSGRGMRCKVVESAAFGRPVVSTPLGAEGLESLRIPLSQTPDEFADAVSAFLSDRSLYESVSRGNREKVEQQFSLVHVAETMTRILGDPDCLFRA